MRGGNGVVLGDIYAVTGGEGIYIEFQEISVKKMRSNIDDIFEQYDEKSLKNVRNCNFLRKK